MAIQFHSLWIEMSAEEKRELAATADTSVAYLSQVANGHRSAGKKTIENLVKAHERISFETFFEVA